MWKLWVATVVAINCSFAMTPNIGVASGPGTFTIHDVKVEGNANVFEGSQIETNALPTRVRLQTGVVLTLGINSAGTFYKDRVLLQRGATRVSAMNQYQIEVARHRIVSVDPTSDAVVRLNGDELQVAALSGAVNVLNERGALLARIGAGTASAFQAGDDSGVTSQTAGTAGQSGATAASSEEEKRRKRRREEMLYLTLGTTLAGLGLAVDAILQRGDGPSPTSP